MTADCGPLAMTQLRWSKYSGEWGREALERIERRAVDLAAKMMGDDDDQYVRRD